MTSRANVPPVVSVLGNRELARTTSDERRSIGRAGPQGRIEKDRTE